jgi:hypothetical protein
MPVAGSGQWGGQAPETYRRTGRTTDLLYLCGGGIVSHPGRSGSRCARGTAGLASGRCRISRWRTYAKDHPELARFHPKIRRRQASEFMTAQTNLLLSYYGDDLTGSTDVMEALASNGVRPCCSWRAGHGDF